jgi:hypothetical protein
MTTESGKAANETQIRASKWKLTTSGTSFQSDQQRLHVRGVRQQLPTSSVPVP